LIGYAEVKPKPTYFDIPTSCANLKGIGHTSSGLYLVTEGELVKNVYCNFTKLPEEAGIDNKQIKLATNPHSTFPRFPERDWIRRSKTETHVFWYSNFLR
jgi:hypothetical protein